MKRHVFQSMLLAIFILPPGLSYAAPKMDVTHPSAERQFSIDGTTTDGRRISITVIAPPSEGGRAEEAISRAMARILDLDLFLFSEGGIESQLGSISAGVKLKLPKDLYDLISKSKNLAALTQGWFDITAPSTKGLFTKRDWRLIILDDKEQTVSLKKMGMKFDLKRIATGTEVDIAMEEIRNFGFTNAKVEVDSVMRIAGHDIFTPWQIDVGFGVFKGANASRVLRLGISNIAMASVKANDLGKGLVDARSKKPIISSEISSVSVFASDAALATAYAIAIYTLGPKVGFGFMESHPEIKGIIVDKSGNILASEGLDSANFISPENPAPQNQSADRGPNDLRQKEREEAQDL